MHHRDLTAYRAFATFVLADPAVDNAKCIGHVMRASGGAADPALISDWWAMWQEMRNVMATQAQQRGPNLYARRNQPGEL